MAADRRLGLRRMNPPAALAVETVGVKTIEKSAPGVITIRQFEETEVREESTSQHEPEEC